MIEQTLLLPKAVKNYGSLIVVCKPAPEEPFEGGHESYFRLSYSHMETRIFNSLPLDMKYNYVLAKILMENISKLVRTRSSQWKDTHFQLHVENGILYSV